MVLQYCINNDDNSARGGTQYTDCPALEYYVTYLAIGDLIITRRKILKICLK